MFQLKSRNTDLVLLLHSIPDKSGRLGGRANPVTCKLVYGVTKDGMLCHLHCERLCFE